MKIELLEIAGLSPVLKALRLPLKSSDKSDSLFEKNGGSVVIAGNKDIQLLKKLIKAGDEHAKVVRGYVFYMDITAPRYWWQEMDTYRVGVEHLSSESTMHTSAKNLTGIELQKHKANIKEGLEQRRIIMFSAQALKRIYNQRLNHRLPEWKQFCKFISEINSLDFMTHGLILT